MSKLAQCISHRETGMTGYDYMTKLMKVPPLLLYMSIHF